MNGNKDPWLFDHRAEPEQEFGYEYYRNAFVREDSQFEVLQLQSFMVRTKCLHPRRIFFDPIVQAAQSTIHTRDQTSSILDSCEINHTTQVHSMRTTVIGQVNKNYTLSKNGTVVHIPLEHTVPTSVSPEAPVATSLTLPDECTVSTSVPELSPLPIERRSADDMIAPCKPERKLGSEPVLEISIQSTENSKPESPPILTVLLTTTESAKETLSRSCSLEELSNALSDTSTLPMYDVQDMFIDIAEPSGAEFSEKSSVPEEELVVSSLTMKDSVDVIESDNCRPSRKAAKRQIDYKEDYDLDKKRKDEDDDWIEIEREMRRKEKEKMERKERKRIRSRANHCIFNSDTSKNFKNRLNIASCRGKEINEPKKINDASENDAIEDGQLCTYSEEAKRYWRGTDIAEYRRKVESTPIKDSEDFMKNWTSGLQLQRIDRIGLEILFDFFEY